MNIIPVMMLKEDGSETKGDFAVLISKKSNTYESRILYSKNNSDFDIKNLTNENLKKWHNLAFDAGKNSHFLNLGGLPQLKPNTLAATVMMEVVEVHQTNLVA